MMHQLRRMARQLFGSSNPPAGTNIAREVPLAVVSPRVLMIVHDPPIGSRGGRRLTDIFGWHNPTQLVEGYIADLRNASGGYLNYTVAERIDADDYPVKRDGFRYDEASYLRAWETKRHHEPDAIDYEALIRQYDLLSRHDRGDFDEVWFLSFPFAGHYESTMVGPGAFWCNSPPVPNVDGCRRRFVMMGFNYERGVDCMLENFGHRTESIMSRVYETHPTSENMWHRFTRHDKTAPGLAECGNVHFAPNSDADYDWGNYRPVPSTCDDWLTYPNLPGLSRTVTSTEWGGGDMRLHHLWWFSRLPRAEGVTDGVNNNWWSYVVDPNLVN